MVWYLNSRIFLLWSMCMHVFHRPVCEYPGSMVADKRVAGQEVRIRAMATVSLQSRSATSQVGTLLLSPLNNLLGWVPPASAPESGWLPERQCSSCFWWLPTTKASHRYIFSSLAPRSVVSCYIWQLKPWLGAQIISSRALAFPALTGRWLCLSEKRLR